MSFLGDLVVCQFCEILRDFFANKSGDFIFFIMILALYIGGILMAQALPLEKRNDAFWGRDYTSALEVYNFKKYPQNIFGFFIMLSPAILHLLCW